MFKYSPDFLHWPFELNDLNVCCPQDSILKARCSMGLSAAQAQQSEFSNLVTIIP